MRFVRSHPVALLATLTILSVADRSYGAKAAPKAVPRHYHRTLWTAGASWEGGLGQASALLSGLYQFSLFPSTVLDDPLGGQDVTAPSLYLHVGGALGGKALPWSERTVFGLGHLGILDRPAGHGLPNWVSSLGPTGVVSTLSAFGIGPTLRIEIMDNIGVQVGAIYVPSRSAWYPFVSLDYFRNLFEDLGLTGNWYWPK